jgi:hypothetical protein
VGKDHEKSRASKGGKTSPLIPEVPIRVAEKQLLPHRLSERNPKSVDIPNDELAHAIKSVVQSFNDFNSTFDPSIEIIDIVRRRYIQVDLTTVFRARFPTFVEHDFAVSE